MEHVLPSKMNPNRPKPSHIIIKMPNIKERLLKAARERQLITFKGAHSPAGFFSMTFTGRKGLARYSQSTEGKRLKTENTLTSKIIRIEEEIISQISKS